MNPRNAALYLQQLLEDAGFDTKLLKPIILYPTVQPWEQEAWGSDGEIAQALRIANVDKQGANSVVLVTYDVVYFCASDATYDWLTNQPFPLAYKATGDEDLIHRMYSNIHGSLQASVEVLFDTLIMALEKR